MHPLDPKLKRARARTGLRAKRGSVLGITLLVALCITVVLAGLIKWVDVESKLARRNLLATKAGYGAEATGEFALAQMQAVLQQRPVLLADTFTSAGEPPVPPDANILGGTSSTLLPAVGSGSPGQLVGDVIGTVRNLLTATPAAPSGGGEDARVTVAPESLHVGPISLERSIYMDPANPMYAGDPLRGQMVRVREMRVVSAARATNARGETVTAFCEHLLQTRDTPLFSFISFYNMDLEVFPQPKMEIHGPVHTNGRLYVGALDSLEFHGVVTSVGGVFHDMPDGSGMPVGDKIVSFESASGAELSMKVGSKWLDSTAADWTSQARNRWGGNVLTSEHGIASTMPAAVPEYTPDNPATSANELNNDAHNIIEAAIPRGAAGFASDAAEVQKFASRASIVIEVSHLYDSKKKTYSIKTAAFKYTLDPLGTYPRATTSGIATFRRDEIAVPNGVVSLVNFTDKREGKTVQAAQIDISVLKPLIEQDSQASQWTKNGKTFSPATEWNGVVYVDIKNPGLDSKNLGAVRLVNGPSVPNRPTLANDQASGFTFATNAPLYVKGNYNADGTLPSDGSLITVPEKNEPPAALVADAVTVLSPTWDDSKSSGKPNKAMEIAAAIITGIVPTDKNNKNTWSGGLNNLVRMLENWDNVKMGFRSSMVVLFESEVATGLWNASVYNPPDRLFGLNQLFAQGKHPPGTPTTRTYRKIGYRKLSAGEYQAAVAELGVE